MYIQKYNIAIIWKTALLCCLFLSVISCVKDPLNENIHKPEPGVPVLVDLNFRVPKFDNPKETKSISAADQPSANAFHTDLISDIPQGEHGEAQPATRATDAPLYNLWVLQFSNDGNARKAIRVSTDDKPIYENQTIEVELMTGSNQTIYLIALGKRYGHIDFTGVKTIDELEATSFDFIRYESGLPTPMVKSADEIPYGGSCSKLSIIKLEDTEKGYVDYNNSDGFSGAINIKALVSLITIDFTYQVENMTPFSISLNNVPTTFGVNGAIHKPSQFVNLPTTLLKPADLVGGKRVTMNWYVAPNPQGTVSSITSEADRYFYYKANSTTSTGTAPRDGTYIHFWGSKDTDPNNYALYYLFLGSNTTNDFNIHPHSHYRYRTDINTADDLNDKRIIYKTLEQSVDFSASATKHYPKLLRNGARYDFDAHPDMRPIELTALRGTVTVEILPGSDNGVVTTWPTDDVSPIDASSSWLKLSTYPNYTLALNAYQKGDKNALATSIKFDASIPGLFRLYLYSDEYEKYTTDNATENKNKRSLFIRFTFQTETDKSNVYITRMDQRSAFYLGEFGGIPTMDGNEFRYPEGLVIESVDESKNGQYLSYIPTSFPMLGAYGVYNTQAIPSDNDMHRYGAYEIYNGREATIMMAENTHHISPIAPQFRTFDKMQEPRYVNGHIDLYQYKYYTGDGFAQRWCYDKNRDKNGNGYLDDNEIVWYMPSIWQTYSLPLNCYTTTTDYLRDSNNGIGTSLIHSSTMSSNKNRLAFNLYKVTPNNSSAFDNITVRCVRNVEPIVGWPQGVKYYEEDNYPVIDATGLMAGVAENRVDNPDVIIIPGPGDDPSYTGRVIRHYSPDESSDATKIPAISQKVSRRFRVAPCDVDSQGQPVPAGTWKTMTWAEAAGYATEANTLAITSDKTAVAESGCAAYRGINGTDPIGKWRLPTIREALLIGMMDKAMEKYNVKTNYIPLYYFDDSNYLCQYWTAAEKPDGTGGGHNINRAYVMNAVGRVKKNTGVNNPAAWELIENHKSTDSSYQTLARCIYDLP